MEVTQNTPAREARLPIYAAPTDGTDPEGVIALVVIPVANLSIGKFHCKSAVGVRALIWPSGRGPVPKTRWAATREDGTASDTPGIKRCGDDGEDRAVVHNTQEFSDIGDSPVTVFGKPRAPFRVDLSEPIPNRQGTVTRLAVGVLHVVETTVEALLLPHQPCAIVGDRPIPVVRVAQWNARLHRPVVWHRGPLLC